MFTPQKRKKSEFLVLKILQEGWRLLWELRGVLFGVNAN
jgi:hypothetical protein